MLTDVCLEFLDNDADAGKDGFNVTLTIERRPSLV